MRVRAIRWIKHNGEWVRPGEVFETDNPAALSGLVEEVVEEEPKPTLEAIGPSAEMVQPSVEAKPKPTRKSSKNKKPA